MAAYDSTSSAATTTTLNDILKEHYTKDVVQNLVYDASPFLAMVPKASDFGGKNLPVPIIFGNGGGRSTTFSQAQTRSSVSSAVDQFTLTRVLDHVVGTVSTELIMAAKANPDAFIDGATLEIDSNIKKLTMSVSRALYDKGYGKVGVVGSSTGATITLSSADDVVNFELGDEVVFSSAESGATLRDSGDSLIISGINRSTGVLTFSTDVSNISGLQNADTIFIKGDRHDSASTNVTRIAGLEAWCPASAPASTAFFGVDRTQDSRLYGLSYDATGVTLDEALLEASSRVGRERGKLSHFFMSFGNFAKLEKLLSGKVQYLDMKVGEVGFRSLVINAPTGPVKVVPDAFCPSNRVFGVQMDTWKLHHLGELVNLEDTDGNIMSRQVAAAGYEVRGIFLGNLACNAPIWNINIQC